MKLSRFGAALLLTACLQGCQSPGVSKSVEPPTATPAVWEKPTANEPQLRKVKPEPLASKTDYPIRERQLTRDLWTSHADFNNSVVSSQSLMSAMILLISGGKGETAAQLSKVSYLPVSQLGADSTAIDRSLSSLQELTQVQQIQVGANVHLDSDFQTKAKRLFHATIETDPKNANQIVLTSTVALKAKWEHPFPADQTYQGIFHSGQQSQQTLTMCLDGTFAYAESADFRVVELPYQGTGLVFDCLLPKKDDGLTALEGSLTRVGIEKSLQSLSPRRVELQIPRFKIASKWNFIPWLEKNGATLAFDPVKADLTGISADVRFYVFKFTQDVSIEVGEEGTKALAVTKASATPAAATPGTSDPAPAEFFADHPFLFLLRDRKSGIIWFIGRVVYPES